MDYDIEYWLLDIIVLEVIGRKIWFIDIVVFNDLCFLEKEEDNFEFRRKLRILWKVWMRVIFVDVGEWNWVGGEIIGIEY